MQREEIKFLLTILGTGWSSLDLVCIPEKLKGSYAQFSRGVSVCYSVLETEKIFKRS